MSLFKVARTAKRVGIITWAFEKTIKLVRTVGSKTYRIIADRPIYEVEIKVGDTHIEVRDKVSMKEVNNLLKAMRTLDHVTIVVRPYKV